MKEHALVRGRGDCFACLVTMSCDYEKDLKVEMVGGGFEKIRG